MYKSKIAFEPQRRKEREGKSVSSLTKVSHLTGSSPYFHKQMNFFVPFESLRLLTAVLGQTFLVPKKPEMGYSLVKGFLE
jgi:hypothetical protein